MTGVQTCALPIYTGEKNNIIGGMKLEYELFDGFKAAVYYGYQSDKLTTIEKYSKDALYRGSGRNGLVRWSDIKLTTKQTDFTITYDVDLTDDLNLNILGGTSYQVFDALGTSIVAGDFISDNILDNLGLSGDRSEEHTSELQSRRNLVCRLLLEKKKQQ